MSKTVILTGKAVVSFRKVMTDIDDAEVEELLVNNNMREDRIIDDDLFDIEWIHDDVEIQVAS